MTEKRKQFLKDVEHEILSLRQNATDKEKEGLDFRLFNPILPQKCIYGQMCGNCETDRARELMLLSCVRVMELGNGVSSYIPSMEGIDDDYFVINGNNANLTWVKSNGMLIRDYHHMSALEAYIQLPNSPNEHILKFIKGEVDELVLL
jgi:hypothetical protein